MKLLPIALVVALLFSNSLYAQNDAKVQMLEKKTAELSKAVTELQNSQERVNELENQMSSLAKFVNTIPLHGFMDVLAGYNGETQRTEFRTGAVDFYLTKNIGSHVKTLIELIFETDGDDLVTDLERFQIGYEFDNGIIAWMGRFHTPYGYWNTAFHHGAQIQTSIYRPKFVDFEDAGGILPAHSTGFWAVGEIGNFGYDIYVTNGSNILSSPENDANTPTFGELNMNKGGDDNADKAIGTNLYYNFDDLRLGVHSLTQEVQIFNGSQSTLNMYGGYFVYDDSDFEIISEVYLFNNKNTIDTINAANSGKSYSSYATFTQVAYGFTEDWTAFVRYEKTDLNTDDVYFASQLDTTGNSYTRVALGAKYDLNEESALKFEYMNTDEKAATRKINDFILQYAVRF